MQITKAFETKLTEWFEQLFCGTAESVLKCGQGLVALIEENQNTPELLLKRYPKLKASMLTMLEQVGRKELLPELLLDGSVGAKRLGDLPYKVQAEVYTKSVPVLKAVERGGFEVRHKTVGELTPAEATQVIAGDRLLNVAEQQQVIRVRAEAREQRKLRYVADANGVQFQNDPYFTWAELEAVIAKHRPAALKDLSANLVANQIKRPITARLERQII